MCLLGTVIVTTNAQNRYWVFPPNYVDFYTGQVLPLPNTAISPATNVSFVDIISGTTSTTSGAPLNKATDYTYLTQRASNGVFNEAGELQYYLNNKAYVTAGKTIVYKSYYGEDLPLLPVPENCDYYYLISDFTTSPTFTLNYKKVSLDGSVIISSTASIPIGPLPRSNMYHFAVTPLQYNAVSGQGFYKIYSSDCCYLYEFLVTSAGITYSTRYSHYDSYSSSIKTEIEISPNHQYVAWTMDWPGIQVTDLATGVTTTYTIGIGTGFTVIGIEFYKSNKVFFTLLYDNPSALNKIGYFELGTGEITQSGQRALFAEHLNFVENTSSVPGSLIELAVDGFMYISDGTYLKGFDPENIGLGLQKSISISNPITSSATRDELATADFYTLVDQIDGADHTNLFQVGCDLTKTISNVTSLDGSLSPISQVSQTIETASSVTVAANTFVTFKAGDQILLQPGFSVVAGGNFRGLLEDCSDFVIDYCSGGGARMARVEDTWEKGTDEVFIDVFPNLTTGIVNLKTGNAIKLISVEIVSSEGKSVLTDDLSGKDEVTLNVSHLSDGVYILQIRHQSGIETRRIVLIK